MDEFKKRIIEDILLTIEKDGYKTYTLTCVYYLLMLHMKDWKDVSVDYYELLHSYANKILESVETHSNIKIREKLPDNLCHWQHDIMNEETIVKDIERQFLRELM
jgi:hypothetical protein